MAAILVILGFSIAFIDLSMWGVDDDSANYFSGLFSLASAMLFLGALLMQNKQLKLQYMQHDSIVTHQGETNIALEKQKELLIQQNQISVTYESIKLISEFKKDNLELNKSFEEIKKLMFGNSISAWKDSDKENQDEYDKVKAFVSHILNEQRNLALPYTEFLQVIDYCLLTGNIIKYIDEINNDSLQEHLKSLVYNSVGNRDAFMIKILSLQPLDKRFFKHDWDGFCQVAFQKKCEANYVYVNKWSHDRQLLLTNILKNWDEDFVD
jgi:hypothetical protein